MKASSATFPRPHPTGSTAEPSLGDRDTAALRSLLSESLDRAAAVQQTQAALAASQQSSAAALGQQLGRGVAEFQAEQRRCEEAHRNLGRLKDKAIAKGMKQAAAATAAEGHRRA